MDIDAMIAAQQKWVDQIDQQIANGKIGDGGMIVPANVLKGNIEVARNRIDRLVAQRDELVDRLDAAIVDEKDALHRLEQTVGDTTPVDNSKPTDEGDNPTGKPR